MTVHIVCPNCNFSKTIPLNKIPAGVRIAICPVCRQKFEMEHLKERLIRGSSNGQDSEISSTCERRDESGILSSIFHTFISILFSPGCFFGSMTSQRGLSEPLAFGILFGSIGTMFSIFWNFLIMPDWLFSGVGFITGDFAAYLIFTGILLLSPLLVLLKMFLITCIFHFCLIILRGGARGFNGTFRVTAFSQATQLLDFFPFIGGFAGFIWNIIVFIIGLARIHGTSYTRITLSLLLPAVFIMAGILMFMLLLTNLF